MQESSIRLSDCEPLKVLQKGDLMDDYESLRHRRWECKYHVVFIPKCRRKTLYAQLRQHLGEVFRRLAQQRGAGFWKGT